MTFELSLNQKQYFRRVYSLLDFLSDVGGLYGALSPFCMLLIVMVNFNNSYQYIMGDLFYQSNDDQSTGH